MGGFVIVNAVPARLRREAIPGAEITYTV